MTGEQNRKRWLDNARWSVQIIVVIYHVLYMYNSVGVPGGLGPLHGPAVQPWDALLYLAYPWMMPVLFLISGMSARYELEKRSGRAYLHRRTVKLLVPSTLGPLVFWFIQGYISLGLSGALDGIQALPPLGRYLIMAASGIGVMWTIQLLWLFSLLLLPVRRLDGDRLWRLGGRAGLPALLALAVPLWASAQVLNAPVIVVYRFGFYGLLFLLGYFVFSHDGVIEALKRHALPLALLAAILGAAFCAAAFGGNYADAPLNRTPLFVGFGWAGCLAILGVAARHADFESPRTRWLSRRGFGLYLCHYLPISAVALFIGKPGLLPAPAVYLLSLAAGFIGGCALSAALSRIPFLRWAALGMEKPRTATD